MADNSPEGEVRKRVQKATIKFAGDSGDGIQLIGSQFTLATAIYGNDFAIFPEFPAEIRAPAGTTYGVSAFQIQFGSIDILTPGDEPDALVAFNPAALKVNLPYLKPGTLIILNIDEFDEINYKKANWESILKGEETLDEILSKFEVIKVEFNKLTAEALKDIDIPHKDKIRTRNFFALGLVSWIFLRPIEPIIKFIKENFGKKPEIAKANEISLKAGYNYGETLEIKHKFPRIEVQKYVFEPGKYRYISGNEAFAYGILAIKEKTGIPVVYSSYPITPASDILHYLEAFRNFGIIALQMEDEIAAVNTAIGASFAGGLGITATSGPGLSLKSEGINLAVMTELPLIVIDNQRSGPSTGMPTKTEQTDLLFALYGRHGESPIIVIAPQSPGDCFMAVVEAAKFAIKYMTPVIVLSDLYIAMGSEPWKIPDIDSISKIKIDFWEKPNGFHPYARDEVTLARPWAKPGTPGLEHRIGGLEKSHIYGKVSYDPQNHDFMVKLRAEKIRRAQADIPDIQVYGPDDAELLVLGWGSTFGHIRAVVDRAIEKGWPVAQAHLRYINPFPKNLNDVLKKFKRILIPELNLGQILLLIKGKFGVDAVGFNKVTGTPFKESELMKAVEKELINMEKEGKLSKHIEVYEGKFIEKREEVAKSAAG
jgi:2-oxoglutarate ferredoxin oxidoreductase subunit alpha